MRPWTTCSLKVRKKRSATPLVSGSPTKAKLAAMPQNLIWFWKWSAMNALPWSWRSVPTLQLAADDHLTSSINAVHLKDRFGDVETDCRNRLHGCSSESWEL